MTDKGRLITVRELKLCYATPADRWAQGLPVGNGRLGAVVCGGMAEETWHVSESTFWSGRPEPLDPPANAKDDIARLRSRFFAGEYAQGEALAARLLQPAKRNFGTNLPLCALRLAFAAEESGGADRGAEGSSIVRELDLEQAVASAVVVRGGAVLRRELLASHPDGVIAARIRSDAPGGVSFALTLRGAAGSFEASAGDDGTIRFAAHALETTHSDGACGIRCAGAVKVAAAGAAVVREGGSLAVRGADEAWIYFAAATDYMAADGEWRHAAARRVERAAARGYERLRAEHVADYRRLFARVALDLGDSGRSALPTDERVRRLGEDGGDGDPQLFALFYQYGRYLMIAGSREDSPLPLHLQGVWNDGEANRMQWSCDYHLDINTQMNYYPAEAANLAECHLPLLRFVERLAEAGRSAARHFYACEGWVAHVFTNAWGFASPGWETSWGLNVTGGLWIAMHLLEHDAFGRNRTFLERTAYPVMKEAALFFLDYMTVHPAYGWLVTGPSNSPENSFYADGDTTREAAGRRRAHQLSMGPTMDQTLVRELFEWCLASAEMLDADAELQARLREAIALLPPLRIGAQGQLQEWLEDYGEAQPDHRHLSHLYGLYPGSRVDPLATPELAAAARRTLERRTSRAELEDVEFTLALLAACFARLRDGDAARDQLSYLIGKLCFDNLLTYSKPGIAGAETNIFVVDGNFGGTAAIGELLLQSRAGELDLLPALPAAWRTGRVAGLRARGGAEVELAWRDGALDEAVIRAGAEGRLRIRCGERAVDIDAEPGGVYRFGRDLGGGQ